MSPPIPGDPAPLAISIDRSSVTTPAVLLGYALSTLLLLARGVRRSWLGGRRSDVPAADEPEADAEDRREEVSP
jgi:hypothetical protein